MSDSSPREWRFYIDDMIGFAEKVIAYTNGEWRMANGEQRMVWIKPSSLPIALTMTPQFETWS